MKSSSFGKCLENCIAKIVKNPRILRSAHFAETLGDAAREWGEISESLNGGNNTQYNLCRMGKYIKMIVEVCKDAKLHASPMNWEVILEDVKYVNRNVRHELAFNVRHISPWPRENDGLEDSEYKMIDNPTKRDDPK